MQFSLPVVKEHKRGAQMRPVLINTQCLGQYQLFWAPTDSTPDPHGLCKAGEQSPSWASPASAVPHPEELSPTRLPRDTGWSSLPTAAPSPVLPPLALLQVCSCSHPTVSQKLIQLRKWRAFCRVPRMGERDKDGWASVATSFWISSAAPNPAP